jgi:hypothetical protein
MSPETARQGAPAHRWPPYIGAEGARPPNLACSRNVHEIDPGW